jgi:hypothetical protein
VRRYQSNEDQIRQLDAKYGNLVSMIAGLGQRHKDMLPSEPEDQEPGSAIVEDAISGEQVRKWAKSVSAQAVADADAPVPEDAIIEDDNPDAPEIRVSHFDRPMRDIRVGESPSRPWGISVPAEYVEKAASEHGSKPPARISAPAKLEPQQKSTEPIAEKASPPRCPFGHGAGPKPPGHDDVMPAPLPTLPPKADKRESAPSNRAVAGNQQPPTFIAHAETSDAKSEKTPPRMVFNGPVFVGYSPEDAAKILKLTGYSRT